MKKILKKSSLIFIVLITFLTLSWGFIWTWVNGNGAPWIQKYLQNHFGLEVGIKKVKGNFINRLDIDEVSLNSPIKIQIPSIQISFKPWQILNIFKKVRSPLFIKIVDPSFLINSVSAQNPQKLEFDLTPLKRIPMDANVTIVNGTILISSPEREINIKKISSSIGISHAQIVASISGTEEKWGTGIVDFNQDFSNENRWKAHFKSENISMRSIQENFLSKSKKYGDGSGFLVINANFDGKNKISIEKKSGWSFVAKTKNFKWAQSDFLTPVYFEIQGSPEEILIKKAKVDDNISITGHINHLIDEPNLDLQIKGNQVNLNKLVSFTSVENPKIWNGFIDFNSTVLGPVNNTAIQTLFNCTPSYGVVNFPEIKGNITLENSRFHLNAHFADGTIQANQSDVNNLVVELQNISLASIAKANGWNNVQGKLTAQQNLELTSNFSSHGNFTINQLSWGRSKSSSNISGNVLFSKQEFSAETIDHSLDIKLLKNNSLIDLQKATIKIQNDSWVSGSGEINLEDGNIDIQFKANHIPPDIWPPLVNQYPQINGALDLTGEIKGNRINPIFTSDLTFQNLQFIPSGKKWNGKGAISGDNNSVSLDPLQFDGGYQGKASWKNSGKSKEWQITGSMIQADPSLFMDLLKSTMTLTGQIDGAVQIQSANQTYIGISSFSLHEGNLNGFGFDALKANIKFQENMIEIENISCFKDLQSFHTQGLITKINKNFNFDLTSQFQEWGPREFSLDGEINSTGKFNGSDYSLNAKLKSASFWINDFPVEEMEINFLKENNTIKSEGHSNFFKFHLNQTYPSAKITGQATIFNLPAEKFFQKFYKNQNSNNVLRGLLTSNIIFEGTLSDPLIRFQVKGDNLFWRNEQLSTSMNWELQKSTLTLISSETNLEKGGTVSTVGSLIFSPNNEAIDFHGSGKSINLQSVFHLLHWPIQWEGNMNGDFSLIGDQSIKKISIHFNGVHKGFGPFNEGGNGSGEITWANNEWNLDGIKIDSGDGHAKLLKGSRIFIDKSGEGRLRLFADVRNVRAGVLTFFGQTELTGSWKSSVEGSTVSVEKDFDVFARPLWINQFLLEGNVTHLQIRDGQLIFSPITGSGQQLTGVLDYSQYPELKVKNFHFYDKNQEKVFLEGDVGKRHWDFKLKTTSVDSDILRALFDTTIPMTGPMDLNLTGKGNVSNPNIEGTLNWHEGQLGVIPVENAECTVSLKNGILQINDLVAKKRKGYELKGKFIVGTSLTPEGENQKLELDLNLEKGDLSILKEVWPDVVKSRGEFQGQLSIKTKRGQRKISGYLNGKDIFLNTNSYIQNLKMDELKLSFFDDKLQFNSFLAHIKKGDLKVEGSISFEGDEPRFYNLSLKTLQDRGIPIKVPELAIPPGPLFGKLSIFRKKLAGISQGEPRFDLHLKGPSENPTLSGSVILENTIFTYPAQDQKNGPRGTSFFRKWIEAFKNNLNWDLTLLTGDRTRYENELVDAKVDGEIKIIGPNSDILVNGKIKANQGAIVYSGNEFKINEAILEIISIPSNDQTNIKKEIEIYLKANAEKEVYYTDGVGNNNQDTIIMVVNRALLGEIQPRFYSKTNSNISSEKALQLALGFQPTESIDSSGLIVQPVQSKNQDDIDRLLRTGLVQLLDSSLASPLARAISRQTGLDYIRVTYQGDDRNSSSSSSNGADSTTTNITQNEFLRYAKGTKVILGRELSTRLTAGYSFRVDEFQNQVDLKHEVELSYRLKRNLFLRAISELDSQRTLGRQPDRRAIIENQWRFGLPQKVTKVSKTNEKIKTTNSPQTR